jgi:hypothetical protein
MYVNDAILERGRDPRSLLAFFFSQRTGSSALTRWLHLKFAKSEVYFFRNVDPFIHWRKLDAETIRDFRVYCAFSEFRPMDFERPVVAFSVVRHPFHRIVSLYEMSKRDKLHRLHELALRTTFEEYYREAAAERPGYFHNVNCYRIAEKPVADAAIEAMGKHYGLVGPTEKLGAMTEKLIEAYGWPLTPLPPASPDEVKYKSYLESPAYEEIVANNREDIKLFDYVTSLGKESAPPPKPIEIQSASVPAPAAPAEGGCPVCGDPLTVLAEGGHCPTCKVPARGRSLKPLLDKVVGPYVAKSDAVKLPLLSFAVTDNERKLLSRVFPAFKSVSLYGKYGKDHETGVDIRDLSRYADNSFSGATGILLFDYFPEFEPALGEAYRVIAPGGALFTLILTPRVLADQSMPKVTREIKKKPGYFEYIPEGGVLYNVTVGQDWMLQAMERAGFEGLQVRLLDRPSGEVSTWFVGFKPLDAKAAPRRAAPVKPAAPPPPPPPPPPAPAVAQETRKSDGAQQEIVTELEGFDLLSKIIVKLSIPSVPSGGLATDFAEHQWIEAEQRSGDSVVCVGDGRVMVSQDLGRSWDVMILRDLAGKRLLNCFTTAAGDRLLQLPGWRGPDRESRDASEWGAIFRFDGKFELKDRIKNGDASWHGPRSIGEANGAIMYGEYSENTFLYRLEQGTPEWQKNLRPSRVYRSLDGGTTWDIAFEQGPEIIRHFHLLMHDGFEPGTWWLTSGDRPVECRVWRTGDDGKTWADVTNPSPPITLHRYAQRRLQCAYRTTDLAILPDRIIWGADDILGDHELWPKFQGQTPAFGARLFMAMKGDRLDATEIGLGDQPFRNIVDVGPGYLAMTEAKFPEIGFEPRVFFVEKKPPHKTQLLFSVPNARNIATGFTYSKASRAAVNGTFFSHRAYGDLSLTMPRLLRWDVSFE